MGAVFTLLFVTLGPLKILGPFAQETRDVAAPMLRQISLRAFAIALVAVLAGGFVGKALLGAWNISVAAMTMKAANAADAIRKRLRWCFIPDSLQWLLDPAMPRSPRGWTTKSIGQPHPAMSSSCTRDTGTTTK